MRARAAVAAMLLVACTPSASGPSAAERRRADLDALVTAVTTLHPEPFGAVSERSWRGEVAAARGSAGRMSDDEFLVTVARLSNLGDRNGHGGVFPTDQPASSRMWGARLYAFADGWHVVGSPDRSLVGARVEAIGGQPVEQVAGSIAPAVPRDNAASLRARLGTYLAWPAVVHGAGNPRGPWTVVDANGMRRDVTPPLVPPAEYATLAGLDMPQIPLSLPAPPYAPRRAWWWQVRRGDALVVGFERVQAATPEGKTLRLFVDRVRADVAARRPRVVVVDIRRNPGGENSAAVPLVTLLRDLRASGVPVRVLVSRATYSAASLMFSALRGVVTFYGEETGGGSSTFGNPSSQALPHSGVVFHVAGARSDGLPAPIPSIDPDERVAVTWKDWGNGIDAVLDAALR